MVEQLRLQLLAHHVVGRRFERQRRQVGGGDAAVEIVLAEARDRRRVDQHLADHDEDDRQHQQPGRQSGEAARQLWRCSHAIRLYHPDRQRQLRVRIRMRLTLRCGVAYGLPHINTAERGMFACDGSRWLLH